MGFRTRHHSRTPCLVGQDDTKSLDLDGLLHFGDLLSTFGTLVSWGVKWAPTFWYLKCDLHFLPPPPWFPVRFVFGCLSLGSQFPSYSYQFFWSRSSASCARAYCCKSSLHREQVHVTGARASLGNLSLHVFHRVACFLFSASVCVQDRERSCLSSQLVA